MKTGFAPVGAGKTKTITLEQGVLALKHPVMIEMFLIYAVYSIATGDY
jgi:hypothetical protein